MATSKNVGRRGEGLRALPAKNGRKMWLARLYWIDPRTGEAHEKRATFQADSLRLARAKRDALLEYAKAGHVGAKGRVKFAQVADEWFATVTSHGSRLSWGSHLRKLKGHFGTTWLDMMDARQIRDYLDALKLGAGTVNSIRDVLGHIFDYALTQHYVSVSPVNDVKRRSNRLTGMEELQDPPKKSLTAREAVALFQDLRAHEPELFPLVMTQLSIGCRFGEASALTRADVDLETGMVGIRRSQTLGRTGPTKGRYARTACLPPSSLAELRAHIARMDDERWPGFETLVFPRPPYGRKRHSNQWSISTAHSALLRSFARIGVVMKGTTHTMRHSFVSLLAEFASEAVLRRVVGHKSEQVHRLYSHAEDAQVASLASVLESRLLTGKEPAPTHISDNENH